ncbi:putative membrane protein [Chitinophaga niastensis]|uniref:Putative membrane protein n=1 Tax=Chitinophaga niastensis TaxID=536980 RepID=A0A2P8HTJ4_CHINA|nr:copper resistance protein NlpE N-terminal domain-containing protein [Chitinophaga niastensis]PSL49546.1 putative membrane protein [Chitinophaga niastensis]
MRTLILLSFLLATMAACNNNTSGNQAGSITRKTTPATTHITGTYQGTLPCADCPGMDFQVSLYDDHTFSELVSYQGRGQGIAEVENGTWKQVNDSTILLEKKKDTSYFLASEGRLLLLDTQGKRIEGVLASNYILKPIEGGDRRPMLAKKEKAGVKFTASGNEPFWDLEIDDKNIHFRTVNGDSLQATLPTAQPNTDSLKVFTAPNITVSIRNTVCSDDMSGLMRPITVQVQIKGKTYSGCGEYLK